MEEGKGVRRVPVWSIASKRSAVVEGEVDMEGGSRGAAAAASAGVAVWLAGAAAHVQFLSDMPTGAAP
jgi:hypothetical protein